MVSVAQIIPINGNNLGNEHYWHLALRVSGYWMSGSFNENLVAP